MKVGDKSVDDFEFEARVDKDIVFAEGFAGFAPEFECARDGSTDGDYAVAGSLGLSNSF